MNRDPIRLLQISTMIRHEIVIARHHEDVAWASNLPAVVYNKGDAVRTPLEQRCLPNVGREAHTYLTHIIQSWDDLASITLFTQAGVHDHIGPTTSLDQFFHPSYDIVVPKLVRWRGWDNDGRLCHIGVWQEKLNAGRLLAARLSFTDWFRIYLGTDVNSLGSIVFSPGAIMAVRRECIRLRSREFYRRLLATVSHHDDPEEAHYLERAWIHIFGTPRATVHCLRP